MGETGFHVNASLRLYAALLAYFRDRPDVFVAADMFLYYERGNPAACKAPDVMVVKGVSNHTRRSFRIWEEGAVPTVIFEMTSVQTRTADQEEKPGVYARLGVKEYFLFDPEGISLEPRLQGYRLQRGRYRPLVPAADGSLVSKELGLIVKAEGALLRLVDRQTGSQLLTFEEQEEQLEGQRQRAKQAEQAKQQAEQAKQQAEQAKQQAEQAKQQAEQAKQQAEQRATVLEEEVARLRAEIAKRANRTEPH
jgi:Uma2 family endonuclease